MFLNHNEKNQLLNRVGNHWDRKKKGRSGEKVIFVEKVKNAGEKKSLVQPGNWISVESTLIRNRSDCVPSVLRTLRSNWSLHETRGPAAQIRDTPSQVLVKDPQQICKAWGNQYSVRACRVSPAFLRCQTAGPEGPGFGSCAALQCHPEFASYDCKKLKMQILQVSKYSLQRIDNRDSKLILFACLSYFRFNRNIIVTIIITSTWRSVTRKFIQLEQSFFQEF